MGRPSLRIQRIFACAVLLAFGLSALAASQTAVDRPDRAFGTRVVVEGLGPVVDMNGEKSLTALRLLNPQPYDITAVVAGSRIVVPADAVVELDTLIGTVVVRSSDELVVTSHTMDLGSDALNTSSDVQRSAKSLTVQATTTVLVTTNSVACKFGTSYAYVEPVAGATYAWTTTGTNVSEGVGTNMVKLLHTGASTASVSVVITVNGTSSTGTATITLRDVFRIATLFPSSTSVTPGQSVTISWTIANGELPRSQVLKINGTAVVTKTSDRSYTFTPSQLGSYTVELSASLVGGRRRSVRIGSSPIPAASFCGSDVRSTQFTVENACVPASGSVNISGSSLEQGQSTTVAITANAAWTLSSDLGNGLSRTSGSGNATVTYTASNAGNDTLRLRVEGSCDSVTRTDSIVVTPPCTPASGSVNIADSSMTVGASTSVSITANGPWTASSTNGTLSQSSGTGNATISFTATSAGTGSVSLIVTSACGNASSSDTVTITVPAPTASISANPTTIIRGQISTLTITVANTTSWTISSSIGNTFDSTGGTGSGTFTRTYSASLNRGTDTITLTATGPGGTTTDTVQIVVQ